MQPDKTQRVNRWMPTVRCMLTALAVRVLSLCLLLVADLLFDDYDTSAAFFPHICQSNSAAVHRGTLGQSSTPQQANPFQRLVLWDSVFFMDISCNGYSYEQQYAFFPLLPGAVMGGSFVSST